MDPVATRLTSIKDAYCLRTTVPVF